MNENDEDATTYEKKVLVFIKTALLSDNLSTFIKEVYFLGTFGGVVVLKGAFGEHEVEGILEVKSEK